VTTNRMSAVENNEAIVKSRKSGLELSSCVRTGFEFAESFGGDSEFVPFLRPTHWPFRLIWLFGQEE
jgi:hypothetical protein